jgi:dTDP-4-amino-4,6-dideoxygalactose transaminase
MADPTPIPATGPIPLVDLTAAYQRHRAGIDAAIARVLAHTQFIQGREVAEFEAAFGEFCGLAHAVGVGSGTAALHLCLAALGIGPGDEVAVPAHTFIATAEPVTWMGARPRFVDVDPETGCLDPIALKSAIDGVRAVIPVDLYGRPADHLAIAAIAADAGVPVIEDAAQAHGAELTGPDGTRRAGSFGVAGCFSFYPGKNLGAFGDAGAITTDDPEFAGQVRMLRDHGRTSKYEHQVVGYAHRLDTIQAAILAVKLSTLDEDNARRRALADAYSSELAGVGDLVTPARTPDRRSVFHLYVLRTHHRDALLAHLKAAGVGAGVHYPVPLHRQPAYAGLGYPAGSLPATEEWAAQCLSLPLFPELTGEQQDRVVAAVRSYFNAAD